MVSAVDMDLMDGKRSVGTFIKRGGIVSFEKDLITNGIVLENAFLICLAIVFVNDRLTTTTDHVKVGENRNGKKHVSSKGKCAG